MMNGVPKIDFSTLNNLVSNKRTRKFVIISIILQLFNNENIVEYCGIEFEIFCNVNKIKL